MGQFRQFDSVIACLYRVLRNDVGEPVRERRFHPVGLRLDRVEIADTHAILRFVDGVGRIVTVFPRLLRNGIGRREDRHAGAVYRFQLPFERQGDDLPVGYKILDQLPVPGRFRHGRVLLVR